MHVDSKRPEPLSNHMDLGELFGTLRLLETQGQTANNALRRTNDEQLVVD